MGPRPPAQEAQSPSFIAVHPTLPVVYAAAEQRRKVQAYRRQGEAGLEPYGEPQRAGEATCHIAVDPHGRFATAACWGDGRMRPTAGKARRNTASPPLIPGRAVAARSAAALLAAAVAASDAVLPAHAALGFKDSGPKDPGAKGQGSVSALHSLRGPVTDGNFYFVMANRFNNGPVTFRYDHFTHVITAG